MTRAWHPVQLTKQSRCGLSCASLVHSPRWQSTCRRAIALSLFTPRCQAGQLGGTAGSSIWVEIRAVVLRPEPVFLLDVILNTHRQITGVFTGHFMQARAAR